MPPRHPGPYTQRPTCAVPAPRQMRASAEEKCCSQCLDENVREIVACHESELRCREPEELKCSGAGVSGI